MKRDAPTSQTTPQNASIPPNRTSDESPASAPQQTRKSEHHDILNAPGQAPAKKQSRSALAADELYGQTQIPDRTDQDHKAGADSLKSVESAPRAATTVGPEHSEPDAAAYNPRSQHEVDAEHERDGLNREFGAQVGAGSKGPVGSRKNTSTPGAHK